ncbi:MAG: hypothetical protein GX444_11450 [Myxococcales bacterium]|nr:hypothetical protein [Myxococcales bacterium]
MTGKIFIRAAILLLFLLVMACGDSDSSGETSHDFTTEECWDISNSCKDTAESASDEYQCELSEQGSIGCVIETAGYYHQTYYHCAEKEVGNDCAMLELSQNKCLAECFEGHVNEDSYQETEQTCFELCGVQSEY